jgi:hypothetical protein
MDLSLFFKLKLPAFLPLLMLLTACLKDMDSTPPSVEVISPTSLPVVNVPDSILLVAEVADNVTLEYVEVSFLNSDRIPVGETSIYFPETPALHIEQYVRIKDKSFITGEYFILIFCSDGVQSKAKYIPVSVHEMPREVSGFALIQRTTCSTTTVKYLDAAYVTKSSFSVGEAYHDSGIDPLHEMFYFVSPEFSVIQAYPLFKPETEWVRYASMPAATYTGLYIDEELVAGTGNGDVWVMDHAGQVIVNTIPVSGRKVQEVAADDTFIVCDMVTENGDDHYVHSFYRKTGGSSNSRKISCDISSIVPLGEDFLLFCNFADKAVVYLYEAESGVMTDLIVKEGEWIDEAVTGPGKRVFYRSGFSIYLLDYENFTTSFFASAIADGLFYEPLHDLLYYYYPNGFGRISYPSGTDLGLYEFDQKVVNFHVIYNR